MNLSGRAVKYWMDQKKISLEQNLGGGRRPGPATFKTEAAAFGQ